MLGIIHLVPTALSMGFHHIHGAPAIWKVRTLGGGDYLALYLSAERDLLRGYEFHDGFVVGAAPGEAPVDRLSQSLPELLNTECLAGFLSISANGMKPSSGIVWASMPRQNQNALNESVRGYSGRTRPSRATMNISREIWKTAQAGSPSRIGHWIAGMHRRSLLTNIILQNLLRRQWPKASWPLVHSNKLYMGYAMSCFPNCLHLRDRPSRIVVCYCVRFVPSFRRYKPGNMPPRF